MNEKNEKPKSLQEQCLHFVLSLWLRLRTLLLLWANGIISLVLRLLTPFVDFLQKSKLKTDVAVPPTTSVSFSLEGLEPQPTCSICDSDFDPDGEGGLLGYFGICPVAFCPWCLSSIFDMVQQQCLRCQEDDEDPPSIN